MKGFANLQQAVQPGPRMPRARTPRARGEAQAAANMAKLRMALYALVASSGLLGFILYAIPLWAAIYFLVAAVGIVLMAYEGALLVQFHGARVILPQMFNNILTRTPLVEVIRQSYYAMRNAALGAVALAASFGLPEVHAHEAEQLVRCLPPRVQRTLLSPVIATVPPTVREAYTGIGHPMLTTPDVVVQRPASPAQVALSIVAGRVGTVVRRYGAALVSALAMMSTAIFWARRLAPAIWNRSRVIRILIALVAVAIGAQVGSFFGGSRTRRRQTVQPSNSTSIEPVDHMAEMHDSNDTSAPIPTSDHEADFDAPPSA